LFVEAIYGLMMLVGRTKFMFCFFGWLVFGRWQVCLR